VPIALTLVVFFFQLIPLVSPPGCRGWAGRLGCIAGIVAGLGYIAAWRSRRPTWSRAST
jgi:hypothetical protein